MKFKSILFVLCLTMVFSASAFAVDQFTISVNTGTMAGGTQNFIQTAGAVDVPVLILDFTNDDTVSKVLNSFVLTTGGNNASTDESQDADEADLFAYHDVNENGIVDPADTKVQTTAVVIPVTTGAAVELAFGLDVDVTVAAGATETIIITADFTADFTNTTADDVIDLIWANAGTAPVTTPATAAFVDTGTAAQDAGDTANTPDITAVDIVANEVTIIDTPATALASRVVGNKAQNVAVLGGRLTNTSAVNNRMITSFTLKDGTWEAVVGDVNTARLYLDAGSSIGAYDTGDLLLSTDTSISAIAEALEILGLHLAPLATADILVVFDLSGTGGVPGESLVASAQEDIIVEFGDAALNVDGQEAIDDAGAAHAPVTVDIEPLTITAVETQDLDGDGLLDHLKLTASDNVSDSKWGSLSAVDLQIQDSAGGSDATLEPFDSTTNGDTANNTVIYQGFVESSMLAADRGTDGLPDIVLVSGNYVTNANGTKSLLAFTGYNAGGSPELQVATVDKAAPIVYSAYTGDTEPDGHGDQITVTFSEAMKNDNANSYQGVTFSDAIFGEYIATAGTVTGSSIVYTVTEKGAYDTESKPGFTYNATTGGLKDANDVEVEEGVLQQSETEDKTPPAIISAMTGDNLNDEAYAGVTLFETAGPNGRIETLVLTLSEAIQSNGDGDIDDIIGLLTIRHPRLGPGAVTAFLAANAAAGPPISPTPSFVNSGTYGTDDTGCIITLYLEEISHGTAGMVNYGDTGDVYDYAYASGAGKIQDLAAVPNDLVNLAATNATDGAAPFIVNGVTQLDGTAKDTVAGDAEETGWTNNRFSNVQTLDTVGDPEGISPDNDDANSGDGFIDAFLIGPSETVEVVDITAGSDWTIANTATYSGITITGIDVNADGNRTNDNNGDTTNSFIIYGTSDEVDAKWDTGETPTVTFGSTSIVDDSDDTLVLVGGVELPSYDTCPPVPVFGLGAVGTALISITWSEEVYSADDAATQTFGNSETIFGYQNDATATDDTADAFSGVTTWTGATDVMTLTADAVLTLDDVENDWVWVKFDAKIFDGANAGGDYKAIAPYTNNQGADFNAVATDLLVNIDDTVPPWVDSATTMDVSGDGNIDYIRLVASENLDDSSITGYDAINTLSADVSAVWNLSGYEGALYFNFFENTAAGREAAFTAGEPVFTDNAEDDTILYLKIDDPTQIASTTGMGTTDYAPTLSWVDPTLADMKPSNTLDTNTSVDAAVDGVGPVAMAATTKSTRKLEVTFSEDIDFDTAALADFNWLVGNVGQTPEVANSWASYSQTMEETSAGVLLFTVSPGAAWESTTVGKFGLSGATLADVAAAPIVGRANWGTVVTAANTEFYATLALATAGTATGGPGSQYVAVFDPVVNNGWMDNNIDITVGFTVDPGGEVVVTDPVGPPADLVLTDVSPDNGHWFYATFTVSADHLTRVKSYQFYRSVGLNEADANDMTWVYSAVVPATVAADNKVTVLVPSVINGAAEWAVVASTGDVLSDIAVAAKATDIPVAMLVDGAAKTAAETLLSVMATATGGAIDNIAPSAFGTFAADNNVDAGIMVTWTAPIDHGVVGYYGASGLTNLPIYGVDSYDVYRRIKGDTEWTLAGTAGVGSVSFIDEMDVGSTVYNYYVNAVDDYTTANPADVVDTAIRSAISTSAQIGDFTGEGAVDSNDFIIFATNYNISMTEDPENWVSSYDLDGDLKVDSNDFIIFATNYGTELVASKAIANMPTNDIPFALGANIDESTSMYFVNVNVGESESLNGVVFELSYDTEALEFVETSVSGLAGLDIVRENEEGIIEVANMFVGEKFDGTITLGFKSKGLNRDVDFEIVNAITVDVDGGSALTTNVSNYTVKALPTIYSLSNNYPNPFNPTTTIDYSIPKSGNVELAIFNIAGQKIRTLVDKKQDASFYKVVWDGRDESGASVSSGMYIYRIVSGNFSKIEKMTLMK